MKAIVVEKPFSLEIRDLPMPEIRQPDEVLIRIIAGGICGSDIQIYNGTNSLATYPRIIGHEFGGTIIKTGSAVSRLKPGDIVAVDPVCSCGKCYACTHNRHNVCRDVQVLGVHRDGGFAEYVVVPEKQCHVINTRKVPARACCLVEPYSIGMQVNNRGSVTAEDKLLVMGSGPIGISIMQVAKQRGAQVMMTDIVAERLKMAQQCGADYVVDVGKQDVRQAIAECFGQDGITIAADTVCSVNSIPQAIDLVCPAGRVVVLGLKSTPSEIAQVSITKKEVSVLGSRLNNYCFGDVITMFEQKRIDPFSICTKTMPFTEVGNAFKMILEHPEQICKINLIFQEV